MAGAFWVVKAAGILLTGEQPPLLFELAFLLLPVALVGLYAALPRRRGRLATAGLALAGSAELSAVTVGLGALLGPDDWVPHEDTATVLTPFIVAAALGTVVALVLLGIETRRTDALPGRWRTFPLALGLAVVPLTAVGGALEAVDERLLEPPILLMGLGWLALGWLVGRRAGPTPVRPAPIGAR